MKITLKKSSTFLIIPILLFVIITFLPRVYSQAAAIATSTTTIINTLPNVTVIVTETPPTNPTNTIVPNQQGQQGQQGQPGQPGQPFSSTTSPTTTTAAHVLTGFIPTGATGATAPNSAIIIEWNLIGFGVVIGGLIMLFMSLFL